MHEPTLGELAERSADVGYVVRSGLAERVGSFLADDSPHRVLLVLGAAGVGKSAFTRHVERVAREEGRRDVVRVDGRSLAPDPGALREALATAGSRPLVVVDTYELVEPVVGAVVVEAVAALPAGARVMLAGRRVEDDVWRREPWASLTEVVRLDPLDDVEAADLLARRGVADADRPPLLAWAAGLPLALELAAMAARIGGAAPDLEQLDRELLDLLTGEEFSGADRDVLAVASLAPFVDARMLDAVLGVGVGASGERWLRSLHFAEPVGRGVTLHDRVRTLLAAELRRFEPEYDRLLRLRLVDHLGDRVLSNEPHLVADLADLAGAGVGTFVRDAMHRFRLDEVRPGDVELVRTWFATGPPGHARRFLEWMEHAPHHVLLVRDGERPAAVALWATPGQRPSLREPDPVVEQWCEVASALRLDDRVVFLTDIALLADSEHWMKLLAIGNTAMLVRAGLPRLRAAFVSHDARSDNDVAGGPAGQVAAFGGVRDHALDIGMDGWDGAVSDPGLRLHGYVIDYGPGGVVGATRDFARAVLEGARNEDEAPDVDVETVRRALRSARRPAALATNPLAGEGSVGERSTRLHERLATAVSEEFGAAHDERLLAAVLVRGYLDAEGSHRIAMRELHLSRSSYYRKVAEATERVAARLLAGGGDHPL